ncbi:MAG: sensor histidine kinase, partial [Candidatus Binatia bacterium]
MKLIPRLRPLGARWLLWLGCGGLTSILVLIGVIDFVRLQSMATSFQKDHNAAKPRPSAGHELEINIIGYSLNVWRYLSGFDAARQGAAKDAADVTLQLDGYTALADTARQRELAGRLRTGWQDVYALGEALMVARTANSDRSERFAEQVLRLERFLDTELQPDAEIIFNPLSAETHGSLQKTEIVTLSLLFLGLAIALTISMAVVRAVLTGEAQLRDSKERLTSLNAMLEQTVDQRTRELRQLNADLDQRVVQRTRALGDSQKKLRAFVEQLTRAEEQERHRLATELNDYLGQLLAVSQINLGRVEKFAVSDNAKNAFTEARQSLDDSIAFTRTLIAQLSPQVLYDLGLPAALAWLGEQMEQQHKLRVEVVGDPAGFVLDEARAILA